MCVLFSEKEKSKKKNGVLPVALAANYVIRRRIERRKVTQAKRTQLKLKIGLSKVPGLS